MPAMADHTFDKLSLAGKTAIVTGSTQGLGERIAHLFAERGVRNLTICGRNQANGARVKAALEARGVSVHYVPADLAAVDDVRRVTAETDRAFGTVDVLVNAAAITDRGTIFDTSPELFDRMFAVNVRAPFFLMQDAATVMRRDGKAGTIVNIISMSGHGGQSFITAYCGSKGALITLTKNVAFSVMRHKIRVNGLTIGWMDTPGEDRIMKTYHGAADNWREKAYASLPTGRMLQPDEVARAVAYLASEESGMMTGSIIDFDQSVLGCYESAPQPAPIAAE
jgi:NAD(P)-dependent dehydrogenase (short-subunit alcohol dehydrogenase family)